MKKQLWKMGSLLTACLMFAAGVAAAESHDPVGTESQGFHGMLVLGTESIYIDHLPMFLPQHRYQGIWEVSFGDRPEEERELHELYRNERRRPESSGRIFTLAPRELFRLPELSASIPRSSFKADLFVGHFERGGEVFLEDVTVNVKRRIHWHPFRNGHGPPERLSYVLFGQGDEYFLAHWITAAPNYHQVLEVTSAADLDDIPEGVQIILPQRSDVEALQAGESVSGLVILDGNPEQPAAVKSLELEVRSEIYLERDELAKNFLTESN